MQWIQWHFTMATLMFLCHVFPVMSRPESMMFRYQTNFFNMLRLKSRLALDSNLNVTALLLSTNVPPSTVDTRAQYSNENLSSEANTEVPKKRLGSVCGVALKEFLTKAESAESHITPSRRSRIVGGEMVHHGEFPWMVSLLLRGRHYCGAVVIDQEWLLTAAHCVYGHEPSSFTALLGSVFSLSTTSSGRGIHGHLSESSAGSNASLTQALPKQNTTRRHSLEGSDFNGDAEEIEDEESSEYSSGYEKLMLVKVNKLVVHENFTRTDFFRNDIALVKLGEKIDYSDLISPVCLPPKAMATDTDKLTDSVVDGTENEIITRPTESNRSYRRMAHGGIVVGWGSVEMHGESSASRRFLKELSRKKLENSRNGTDGTGSQWKSIQSTEDVLRLRKVELPFIDRFTCERWYSSRGRPIRLIDHQFCAGLYEGGKDACRGDSGGPMLERIETVDQDGKPVKDQYNVVGIVSAGIGCALPKLPGIYTRVESYIEWIHLNMLKESSERRSYEPPDDDVDDTDLYEGEAWKR